MSDVNQRNKPVYETPTVIALGGLARGTGYCAAGSGATDDYCTAGLAAGTACTEGGLAPAACTAGTSF
ncbi:MAG: hypothetical protein IPQ16_13650 [Geobacteraceae bacterium]|nr:hypothetical protein [Geobacteraceae bacterium]